MRFGAAAAAFTIGCGLFGAAELARAQAVPAGAPAAATHPADGTVGAKPVRDPWEGWNRGVFAFNTAVDRAVAEPVARVYRRVTPTPIRSGVRNWVANLDSPVIFANDLFQGEAKRAGVTAARFTINTTIGILGLFDAAGAVGLPRHSEDFGQTLGRYGVSPGPYIMLPVLGPSSLRDLTGGVVDIGIDPLTYARFKGDDTLRISRGALNLLTARTDSLDFMTNLRNTSPDPYVTLRTLYGLSRESEIRNGRLDVQELPDFADPLAGEGPMEKPTP